jgi:hypothetical protein
MSGSTTFFMNTKTGFVERRELMESTSRLRLKRTSGWFAAGREMARALPVLSDSAFKLYVYVCLNADRRTGKLRGAATDLAAAIGKEKRQTVADLQELESKGVAVGGATGEIEITDSFWPYEKLAARGDPNGLIHYIGAIKRLLLTRACVQCSFTRADEQLATELHRQRVSLEQIGRAILLGCVRKYIALINHPGGTPITSLHYFTILFSEVRELSVSPDYWRYVAVKVEQFEKQWREIAPGWAGSLKQETK